MRGIGERSDAVLRTAMPAHDEGMETIDRRIAPNVIAGLDPAIHGALPIS
jgi:hypothetical protein